MRKIIRHTKFKSNPFGDGGEKRSAQIKEILIDFNIKFEDDHFKIIKDNSLKKSVQLTITSFFIVLRLFTLKELKDFINFKQVLLNFALKYQAIFEKYKNQDILFIWESTVAANYSYPYLFKLLKQPAIAIPHNLESLVPTQSDLLTSKSSPLWFEDELKRLSMCDAIFTISREECWLLKLYGLNTFYLPYYPAREVESNLLKIREKRINKSKKESNNNILLLGSATNPPTFYGMKELIIFFNDIDIDIELHIGGYKTELLQAYITKQKTIKLHGTLSNDELDNLMLETDAVLIYQQATTGALTRIPEMLIAGIPILINADAARSFYDINGITIYNSMTHLTDILKNYKPILPDVLKKPENLYVEFIEIIRKYSKN